MTWFGKVKSKFRQISWLVAETERLRASMGRVQEAIGRIETRQIRAINPRDWHAWEFSVYSQFGEDGLLQYLTAQVPIARKLFVEFGAQRYTEANTRLLTVQDHWSGLLLEADGDAVAAIRQNPIYWQFNLKAVQAMVTRENINALLRDNGMSGEIGVLSIDIDGNDYWVWEAITEVQPAIVVIEYNHRYGPERAVTIPYDAQFSRGRAHSSMIYYGASLAALHRLGERKGYALVGCTRAGNDAFFVRRDLLRPPLEARTPGQAFVAGQFRESRDAQGQLLFLSAEEEQAILSTLPLVNVP